MSLFQTSAELFAGLFAEANGDAGNDSPTLTVGDCELQPSSLPIEKLHFSMLPQELLNSFVFREEWIVQPKQPYVASSLIMSVVPVRLDENGKLANASPSIKNAKYSVTSNYPTFDEENERARFKPDLFVQADFFTDGEVLLPIPTLMKRPYPAVGSGVSVALCDVTKKTPDCQAIWNTARRDMERRLGKIAKHLGVPANEQFLLVIVGCPSMTKVVKGGDDKPLYGAAFPNGGYFMGAAKLASGRGLPPQLADLKVDTNMMIGGKSLQSKLQEQLLALRADRKEIPAAAPTPVRVAEPVATPAPQVEEAPAPTGLPKSGLLDLLGEPDVDPSFQFIDEEDPADFNLNDYGDVYVSDEDQPVYQATVKKSNDCPFLK